MIISVFFRTIFAEYHVDQSWSAAQKLRDPYYPQRTAMLPFVPSVIGKDGDDWLSKDSERWKRARLAWAEVVFEFLLP